MTLEIEGVPASVTRQQVVDLLATLVLVRRLLPADALAVQVRPPGPRGASDQRQDRRRDVSEQLVAAINDNDGEAVTGRSR